MLVITLTGIPNTEPDRVDAYCRRQESMRILTKMFPDKNILWIKSALSSSDSMNFVEAGDLQGTRWRLHEKFDVWATITPVEGLTTTVEIEFIDQERYLSEAGQHKLGQVIRTLRNFCEEYYEDYSSAKNGKFINPAISSYMIPGDLVGSPVQDELEKAMLPLFGVSTKE